MMAAIRSTPQRISQWIGLRRTDDPATMTPAASAAIAPSRPPTLLHEGCDCIAHSGLQEYSAQMEAWLGIPVREALILKAMFAASVRQRASW
jgi:hypothetical protein